MADISEAFGPKYKNNKVKKLFSTRGREVQGISDFFRDDDVFIGVGNETLAESDIVDIIEETYPDSPYAKNLLKDLERNKRKRQLAAKAAQADNDADKRDSGFGEGSDGSNRDPDGGDYVIYKGRAQDKGRRRNDYPKEYELAVRLDREREKAAADERERTKNRQKKTMEAERRALDEERRKRGLVPAKGEDPFKRMKEQKEREKEEQRRRKEEDRMRRLEEEERERQRKRDEERDNAIKVSEIRDMHVSGVMLHGYLEWWAWKWNVFKVVCLALGL